MRVFFLLTVIVVGCGDLSKTLPQSTGKNSEVVFVVEDILWQQSIDTLASRIFEAPIMGINQREPLFKIIQIKNSELKSFLKLHKNIIIISREEGQLAQTNKWAADQYVAQVYFNQNYHQLSQDLMNLREIFIKKEVNMLKRVISKNSQKKIEADLLANFGITCLIPEEYEIINNEKNFFWATYNPQQSEEIKKILIFSFTPNTTNLQGEVLSRTDSVFNRYLKGSKEESFVKIEPQYPPYYSNNVYRGLWRMQGGFMGGVFLFKTYFLKEKVVIACGLVFAPQSQKRKYIKEFEAIL